MDARGGSDAHSQLWRNVAPDGIWRHSLVAETFRQEHRSALQWLNSNSRDSVSFFGMSDTQLAYRDWWAEFLPAFRERYPGWSRAEAPSKKNWMRFPSGKSGFRYSVNFPRRDGRPAFRFELYVDGKDNDDVNRRFTQLLERRAAIEDAFEDALDWEPLYRRRASRVACYFPEEVAVHSRERWSDVRAWTLARMGPFREVLQPHIDTLG